MVPTQKQIADRLGVSRQLVGFALSGNPSVAKESSRKIRELAQKLGYQPNHAARALVTGRNQAIAVRISEPYTSYCTRILRSVSAQLKQSGYEMIVTDLSIHSSQDEDIFFSRWPVDGVLVVDAPWHVHDYLKTQPNRRLPCVSMGSYCSDDTDSVRLDLRPATIKAVRHLIATGRRRIAYMSVPIQDARHRGYTAAMREAGLKMELIAMEGSSNQRPRSRHCIRHYVREHGCPEGIFCQNDDIAIGVCRGLRDLEIRVPEDVAIVGCDAIEDTEYLECPVTTISYPVDEMCATAWKFLWKRIKTPRCRPQRAIFPSALVIRASSSVSRGGAQQDTRCLRPLEKSGDQQDS